MSESPPSSAPPPLPDDESPAGAEGSGEPSRVEPERVGATSWPWGGVPVAMGAVREEEEVRQVAQVDPWAHRRGEPRLFAFFWTFYVLLAVAGSLSWVARYTSITASSYSPAARIMLVVLAVGMVVLWPMTRLSQSSPERHPVLSSLADLIVVLVPVQIVVWPLIVLASWPRDVVVGVAALFAAWAVATGGLVAVALSGARVERFGEARAWWRAAWMVVALALAFGAVIGQWALAARGLAVPAWLLMGSPVTAIAALTGRGLSGPSAPVSQVQWDSIVGTLSVAVLLWSLAVLRHGVGRGRGLGERG